MSRKTAEVLWMLFQAIALQVAIDVGMGTIWLPVLVMIILIVNLALVHRYVRVEIGRFTWGGFKG